MVFPEVVWFPVDASSTPSIGVSSIVSRLTTLVRLERLHAQLSIGFQQLVHMCSSLLSAAPAIVGAVAVAGCWSSFCLLLLPKVSSVLSSSPSFLTRSDFFSGKSTAMATGVLRTADGRTREATSLGPPKMASGLPKKSPPA